MAIDGEEVITLHDYCDVMPESGTVTLSIYIVAEDRVVEADVEVGGFGG